MTFDYRCHMVQPTDNASYRNIFELFSTTRRLTGDRAGLPAALALVVLVRGRGQNDHPFQLKNSEGQIDAKLFDYSQ